MRRSILVSPLRRARRVLGLNARNLMYVHGLNPRRHFPLADDKVLGKRVLHSQGVPVPETLAVLSSLSEISGARERLEAAGEFVVKPARGRQGSGIVVVLGREGDRFRTGDGGTVGWEELRRAMGDILFGTHSIGQSDRVVVERRVLPHPDLGTLAEAGLPDIRVILLRGASAMAMMRVPTRASGGRANLHQGAAGIALRLSDGFAFRCLWQGEVIASHPDNGSPLVGFRMPRWGEILDVARRAGDALPLPYLGVDVVLAEGVGALVMEVNVRPGLEIQNVNRQGLRRRLERLAGRSEESR